VSKDKPYVSTVATMHDTLSAIAKLPGIIDKAIRQWGQVDITVKKHEPKRSLDQNRLQRLWCKEAAEQGDMTAEEYRGYCKYHFGLSILCRDSDEFRAACKRVLGALSYEQCIALMMEPHDYPVTRGMSKKQKAEYLDRCYQHFTSLGFRLTDPGLRGTDSWRECA
jgi:hypothetical protein